MQEIEDDKLNMESEKLKKEHVERKQDKTKQHEHSGRMTWK